MKLPAYLRKSLAGVSGRDCDLYRDYFEYKDYSIGYVDYHDVYN